MRKTKIIATIGPATADRSVLKEIILKGVNI
jgi:pyruvate kinase